MNSKLAIVIRHYSPRKQFLYRVLESLRNQSVREFITCVLSMDGKKSQIIDDVNYFLSEDELFKFLDQKAVKYISVLDDDDTIAPEFFSRTLSIMDKLEFDSVKAIMTHTNRVVELCEGNRIKVLRTEPLNHHLNYGVLALDTLRYKDALRLSSCLFDYESFKSISVNHDLRYPLFFWPFIIEFGATFDIWVIGEAMSFYHVRETSDPQANNYSYDNPVESEVYIRMQLNKLYRSSSNNPALSGIVNKLMFS